MPVLYMHVLARIGTVLDKFVDETFHVFIPKDDGFRIRQREIKNYWNFITKANNKILQFNLMMDL